MSDRPKPGSILGEAIRAHVAATRVGPVPPPAAPVADADDLSARINRRRRERDRAWVEDELGDVTAKGAAMDLEGARRRQLLGLPDHDEAA